MTKLQDKQLVVAIYYEYYGKYPDFNLKNKEHLTIEMQSMFYILEYYGVSFGYIFTYNTLKDFRMPISMDLQDTLIEIINKQEKIELIEIKAAIKQKILIIKNIINKEIIIKNNKYEALKLISSVIYSKQFMLPSSSNNRIAEFNNCTINEVDKIDEMCLNIINELDKFYKESYEKELEKRRVLKK